MLKNEVNEKQIRSRNRLPILVGGTCYYALNFLVRRNAKRRRDSGDQQLARHKQNYEKARQLKSETERNEALSSLLAEVDPEAHSITKHNPAKFITYLDSYFNTGPLNQVNQSFAAHHSDALFLWVSSELDVLNDRIDKRADSMVTAGLRQEIASLSNGSFDFTQGTGVLNKILNSKIVEKLVFR